MDEVAKYPFVGRGSEKTILQHHLREAVVRGRGCVVFIAGEAGIGKTMLVREFLAESQRRYNRLLATTGTCDAITGIGDGFLPFTEILDGLLGGQQSAATQENARRLRQLKDKVLKSVLDLGPDLVGTFIPIAGLLLKGAVKVAEALDFPPTKADALVDDSRVSELSQEQLFEQYLRVLRSIAAESPLVLVLDDLQWADQSSLNLLFHLGRRISGDRILIIGLYRPSDVQLGRDGQQHPLKTLQNELSRYAVCHTISLSGLDPADVRQYLDQRFQPHQFPTGFVELTTNLTDGNPLFLVELLEHLISQGQVVYQEGLWQLATDSVTVESLPDTLEAVIGERVERLAQELQDILACASVEGEDFTAQVVARVRQADEFATIRCLARELDEAHRLVWEVGERELSPVLILSLFRFRHTLVHLYTYKKLVASAAVRRMLHCNVGLCLEEMYGEQRHEIAAQLVHHFQEGRDDKRVAVYALMAARQEYRQLAMVEAERWCLVALDALCRLPDDVDTQPIRYGVALQLGKILDYTGRWEQAVAQFQWCLALAKQQKDSRHIAIAYNLLASITKRQGFYGKAITQFERAIEAAKQVDDQRELAFSYNYLGIIYRMQERYDQAIKFYVNCLQMRQEMGDEIGAAFIQNNIGKLLRFIGEYDKALTMYQAALLVRREHGKPQEIAETLRNIAEIHRLRGECIQAMPLLEESLALKRTAMYQYGVAKTLNEMALTLAQLGNWDAAQYAVHEALTIRKHLDYRRGIAESLLTMAVIHKLSGKYPEAEQFCRQAMEIQVALQYEVGIVENLTHQVEVLLLQGETTRARLLVTQALARLEQWERRYERAWLYLDLATTNLLAEAYQQALEPFQEALATFESMKVQHGAIVAVRGLTCVHTRLGTLSQAEQYERQARGLLGALGYQNARVRVFERLFI